MTIFMCPLFLLWSSVLLTMYVSGYDYNVYLDPDRKFLFQWSVDYSSRLVEIGLTLDTSGVEWFAVGFSDYGEVEGSDLGVFWTDKDNYEHFVDSHVTKDGRLFPDDHQDYKVLSVGGHGSKVSLDMRRQISTCDQQDYTLDNGTTHIIYVFSNGKDSEPPFGDDVTGYLHGLQRVQILKPETEKIQFPVDTWSFDVLAPEVLVPGVETTYWWHTTLLPSVQTPHHIIKYEPVIGEGSESFVHHMEVFHCSARPGEKIPYFNGPGLGEGKPKGLEVCRKVLGAWAMGAEAMEYPEEAGIPIGGHDFPRFALLEIHYNNPNKKTGHMDKSGIRFYVTSQLRPNDAGILELGLEYSNNMAIPPGQPGFPLSGYCVSPCTHIGLQEQGIHIFASQLHTHLTGRKVKTRHIRSGVELPPINKDNHYSPHYQEIRRVIPPVQVLPGDALIVTCTYDTRGRDNATVGGFAITDEMCVNYIHYYPATQLEVCKSSIETQHLDKFFLLQNRLEGAHTDPSLGDRENYNRVKWSTLNVRLLQLLYATSPLSAQCNQSNGQRFPGQWGHVQLPFITQPWSVDDDVC